MRALYRLPFDLLEEISTGCASLVLVNSAYTASVYAQSFRLLRAARALLGGPLPSVLHPAIDLVRNRALAWPAAPNAGSSNDLDRHKATLRMAKGPTAVASAAGEAGARLTKLTKLVSINRFERKKALELAVHALLELRRRTAPGVGRRPVSPGRGGGGGSSGGGSGGGGNGSDVRLVLAGGWDGRLQEQVDYLAELEAITDPDLKHRRLVELNVIEQCLNIFKLGVVQRRRLMTSQVAGAWAQPRVHGLVYCTETGRLINLAHDFRAERKKLGKHYELFQ